MSKRILLLSAYDAQSHRYWYQQLVQGFSDYQWTILTLPGRYFAWRTRGNSLSWAFSKQDILEQQYDLLLTTSMVDLSALRGFVPNLASIPTIVYFHENQFAYPSSDHARKSIEPAILNLYTALCADKILFNSHFNRDTFLGGVEVLLRKLPDEVPKGIYERLNERSSVLPVPIKEQAFVSNSRESGSLILLWNHRWEYDKGPEQLLDLVVALDLLKVDFKLVILGQAFRKVPESFAVIEGEFSSYLLQMGYVEDPVEYRQWLARADVVISTAIHDFQGLAIMEAVAAGALPLLPNRLAYPEWFDEQYLYRDTDHLSLLIQKLSEAKKNGLLRTAPDITSFCWSQLKSQYQAVFTRCFSG